MPDVDYNDLPVATLPLQGDETVTFMQGDVTVKALLSDIFKNISGVALIGPLTILNTAGDIVGTLQQNNEIGVGFQSADGHTQFTISNDQNELRAQIATFLSFLGVLADSISAQVSDSDTGHSGSMTLTPNGWTVEYADDNFPGNNASLQVNNGGVNVSFTGDSPKQSGPVAVQIARATADRPDPTLIGAGYMIFDSDLGKPIWSNGTAWVDATGAIV